MRGGVRVLLIVGPDAPLRARVGTAVAFFSASASLMLFRDEADAHPEDLRAIFLEIADDLTRL